MEQSISFISISINIVQIILIFIGSKILTNFNEECHHVEQLLNVDAAVAVLVKQVEHLHNVKEDDDDDDDDADEDDDDDDDDNDDDGGDVDDDEDLTYPMTTCEYPSCGWKGETDDPHGLCTVSGFSGPEIL